MSSPPVPARPLLARLIRLAVALLVVGPPVGVLGATYGWDEPVLAGGLLGLALGAALIAPAAAFWSAARRLGRALAVTGTLALTGALLLAAPAAEFAETLLSVAAPVSLAVLIDGALVLYLADAGRDADPGA